MFAKVPVLSCSIESSTLIDNIISIYLITSTYSSTYFFVLFYFMNRSWKAVANILWSRSMKYSPWCNETIYSSQSCNDTKLIAWLLSPVQWFSAINAIIQVTKRIPNIGKTELQQQTRWYNHILRNQVQCAEYCNNKFMQNKEE